MFLEISVIALGMIIAYFMTQVPVLALNFEFMNTGVIYPDYLLMYLIFFALYRGEFAGIWLGFFAGLLEDGAVWVLSDATREYVPVIGIHASIYSLTGFILGKMNRIFDRYNMAPIVLLVLGTTFVVRLLTWILQGVLGEMNRNFVLVGPALYTALISPIFFTVLSWLYRIRPGEP
ncbi:MAG: rod shape-determining protein MreD [Leptospiraceae bacterium]|nr:rod shape-determining protein MreD [Leptospiraceae bacterium]MCB1315782.1 rod shape-determining protein MreD [Leptospiraceae bacterium]MCB1320815.1 rod shape-determining protein MreD [Leptospiraceae bacterium]